LNSNFLLSFTKGKSTANIPLPQVQLELEPLKAKSMSLSNFDDVLQCGKEEPPADKKGEDNMADVAALKKNHHLLHLCHMLTMLRQVLFPAMSHPRSLKIK
jgi:hypothetical protein